MMTAAGAAAHSATFAEQRAHEPSMEEILASIRRIIADDQVSTAQKPGADLRGAAEEPSPPDLRLESYRPPGRGKMKTRSIPRSRAGDRRPSRPRPDPADDDRQAAMIGLCDRTWAVLAL